MSSIHRTAITQTSSYLRLKELAGLERGARPVHVNKDGRKKEFFNSRQGDVIIILDVLHLEDREILKAEAGRLLTYVHPRADTAARVQNLLSQDRDNRFASSVRGRFPDGFRIGIYQRIGSTVDELQPAT
jgi:hypothetical protein